jgi:hypothetical protein
LPMALPTPQRGRKRSPRIRYATGSVRFSFLGKRNAEKATNALPRI